MIMERRLKMIETEWMNEKEKFCLRTDEKTGDVFSHQLLVDFYVKKFDISLEEAIDLVDFESFYFTIIIEDDEDYGEVYKKCKMEKSND